MVCDQLKRLIAWIPKESSRSRNLKAVIDVWRAPSVWHTAVNRCLGPSLWGMVLMEVGRCGVIQYCPSCHMQTQKPHNTKPRLLETGNLAKIFNQVILSLPLKWLWYAF